MELLSYDPEPNVADKTAVARQKQYIFFYLLLDLDERSGAQPHVANAFGQDFGIPIVFQRVLRALWTLDRCCEGIVIRNATNFKSFADIHRVLSSSSFLNRDVVAGGRMDARRR